MAAPKGNKNARSHGAYEKILYSNLTGDDKAIADETPKTGKEALIDELKILKVREKRLLDKITYYENIDEEELKIATASEGANEAGEPTYTNFFKESAFNRILKLQDALYKLHGRIVTVASSIGAAEESERRLELEKEKLELARLKATGEVVVDDAEEAVYE